VTKKDWDTIADDELNEEGLAVRKHEEWLKKIDVKYN
jgi:hypothetical protein